MTDRDFSTICQLAYKITGIKLSDHKRNMVYGRLARRLRKLNLGSFQEYCELLEQEHSPEESEFVNSITTNLTSFFRESHHFDHLKSVVIPELKLKNRDTRKIRIWSAGCSTGEEPYSIAMSVKSVGDLAGWDIKILATDLDTNVVEKASSGVYTQDRVEKIPPEYNRFFQISKGSDKIRIRDEVRDLITFKQLNLLHQWPMKGPFDIIFCRNVVIYFDADTQKVLFDRYRNILTPQGYLYIGHSENLHKISRSFVSKGRTIYQRMD